MNSGPPDTATQEAPVVAQALPRVSVVVAARDAERTIRRCLESLLALDYEDVEIILADDGSSDATVAIARQYPIRLLQTGGRGPSAARNAGVAVATGSIVAFTDADCTVDRRWARALVDAFAASGAASVGGRQINCLEGDAPSWEAEALDAFFRLASVVSEYTRSDTVAHEVPHNASCNSAYRRDVFLEIGGFHPGLWPGEDVELDHRVHLHGYRCFYTPDAVVMHHRAGTRGWFAATMRRYGSSMRELLRMHGPFRPLHWFPMGLLTLAAIHLLWLPPATRMVAGLLDALLLGVALFMLARSGPVRLWPAMLWYALIAIVEWNRGYAEAVRFRARHSRPVPDSARPDGANSR